MSDFQPPASVTFTFDPPLVHNGLNYGTCTLRAPKASDMLKATADRTASQLEMTLRLLSAISSEGVPFEALVEVPQWQIDQMSGYIDSFAGAPPSDPLAEWREAKRTAAASRLLSPEAVN